MARLSSSALIVAALLAASGACAHEAPVAAGAPAGADAGAKDAGAKIVEVDMRESDGRMLFSPDRLDVAKGQTVRFVVHNAGALPHEFVVGTKAANAAHARMMAAMPDMTHHDANAISLKPGATRTLTWRFARSGTFEFACLLPGHYSAGMHGEVAVR